MGINVARKTENSVNNQRSVAELERQRKDTNANTKQWQYNQGIQKQSNRKHVYTGLLFLTLDEWLS